MRAATALEPIPTKDRKVIRRWELKGDPRGVAVGADGTIYAGLAESQAVVAIDPDTGAIKKRVVLDSPDIASTKELVTLRTNPERTRLFIANGSDESAMILSLPGLAVLREITMEGETIRDAVPDPKGRYLYLLGRRVHVYDKDGKTELRTIPIDEPMAIAANATTLAVVATENFGNTKATSVSLFDVKNNFSQLAREPLQTTDSIEAAMFAASGRSLIAFSRTSLFEKPINSRALVNSNRVCLPEGSGPQVATLAGSETVVVYGERRCSAAGVFDASPRGVTPASLYGVEAYALAFDPKSGALAATDRKGTLTIYSLPRPALAR
ncbi:MAG TPA: hypothetical protein VM733_09200 [Thermoanaerobaculia bacterium]|nr:hypothetical protein [Thermoanaerobaculia bacterium]